ncbi:protein of unknown function [Sporobacter termitidis DSM 10068]|uniref:DUF3786 domain-containing protein n=1 Tax=Sporobacter termitidis DSM 10068 TaxID=1123282 RepID=A0A1M5XNI6_9FIRM|nr:DUF3786 domain-containing protein [Sporobacter termitidis]SHI01326.1 protein of unknown function [Sporobacter termitidis DSM 10068]
MAERNPNQQYGVPLAIYQERYGALDPEEVSRRAGVPFDPARGVFTLTVLGFEIDAAWPEFSLAPRDAERCPSALYDKEGRILLIRYLIEGTMAEPTGAWLPYRELPWGDVYDRNFQGRCIKRLAFGFGAKPGEFARACQALGGVPYDKGDASYDLAFLPHVTVRLILWSGDDEFPPQSQWLFSDNMPLAFTAEDVACMGDVIIGALKEIGKK